MVVVVVHGGGTFIHHLHAAMDNVHEWAMCIAIPYAVKP